MKIETRIVRVFCFPRLIILFSFSGADPGRSRKFIPQDFATLTGRDSAKHCNLSFPQRGEKTKMNSYKRLLSLLVFSASLLTTAIWSYGQGDPSKAADPTHEAVLHVLVESAQGAAGESVPQSLAATARQLRSDFGASNLRLINTHYGRLSNAGNLEYKGVSAAYSQESQAGAPSFMDWRLSGLRSSHNSAGQAVYQLQGFRFGARVPVRVGTPKEESGPAPINYESIGLTLDRVSIRENTPTLIGTLIQPKTDATVFLILTVRNVDK